ncbi:putative NAD(P)H--quinone oxidoreductase [Nocardia brasiliensis NBRC 14402]|uniref:SDR family oxidoreductase n=1 Tax=Nocardia brasiliensis TaxID=37326 RepID=UPI00030DCFAF|nr:SDR family oxidoreductase [Nocardia brasiliensis]ASF11240.2 SDR family NAD(P)-dependent oxidoreductase [Nocardia brasiliensis]GAJ81187.1 putative NAD(P)H--quinone oxidoreductase [Nocardia brasiliensis NBRC 14402]SUB10048.1 Quinone oxidoreductase 2 [Nocardia brasiliensis]
MTVAVTAASGQLGRLVVESLLRAGVAPIVAIVRDPGRVADLAEQGVQVRAASYDDAEALDRALAGVDRVLLVSGNEFGARVAQHTNVIRAAERAGVRLLAYTSIPLGADSPLILAQEHIGTEAVLAESTVPHAILRNSWYWENYLGGLAHTVESGVLHGAAGTGRVSGAARADYAEAAAKVLTTEGHEGQVYELGGDEHLTYVELAQVISQAAGKPVRYENLTEAQYRTTLVQAGIPEEHAQVLADADSGLAAGALDVTSGHLQKLLGRSSTPALEVFRAALA